jgi:signal transduction histidine kinase
VNPAEAWRSWFWLWDLLFAITYAVTLAIQLFTGDTAGTSIWVAITAETVIAVAYLGYGRRIVRQGEDGSREAVGFMAVALLLFVTAVLADANGGFVLFALCPLAFMLLDSPIAVTVCALAILMPPLAVIVKRGFGDPSLSTLLPMTAMLIVASVLMGRWTERIVNQSNERAELITKLEASQAEVSRLSREAGTAAERERLAREIHDTLAQGFTSIVTLAQAMESELDTDPAAARRHLELAARTARENLAEARQMVAALSPSALAGGSLEDAVRRQAERLSEESTIAVTCEITPLPALGTATEVVFLRAAQEALTNIRKHANASAVYLRLSVSDGLVRLSVTDDGAGFDPGEPAEGFGLRGMRARVAQVGGEMRVHSGRSKGTTVELEVPA